MVAEVLLLDHLDRGQAGGRRQRVLLVGVVADGALPADVVLLPGHDPRKGNDPAAERFTEDQDVRRQVMVAREHLPGPAEPLDDLVEDQQRAIPPAQISDTFPVPPAGHDGIRGNRLPDHRGHLRLPPQDQFDLPEAFGVNVVRIREPPGIAIIIGEFHMKGPGNERPDAAVKVLLAPHARRPKTGPMEGVPVGDCLEATRHEFCQLQRHLDRIRPPRTEEGSTEPAGCNLRQFLRQSNGRDVRVAPRAEGKRFVQLSPDRLDHFGVVEAGVVHAVAVHVDVFPARQVLDINPPRPGDHVEDGGGEALVEEIPRILLEPTPRLAGQVPFPVPLSRRRGVDIPLFRLRSFALFSEPLFCHADTPPDSSGCVGTPCGKVSPQSKHKPVASPTPTIFLNSTADYPCGSDPDQGKKSD